MVTEFTPFASLLGGLLIGLSAVLLMFLLGRIMGATGIVSGALMPDTMSDWAWRVALLLGMFSGPWLFRAVSGELPEISVPSSPMMLLLGGLLVGVGVTLGSGCTSGHGVCGLARGSFRSFAAVALFMTSTVITVFVTRHVLGV